MFCLFFSIIVFSFLLKVIPLAMMTAWSWSWDGGPSYAAHATLGSVIAHEILHAFDLHHRRLPIDPDIVNDQWLWITPEAWSRLEAKIECVARLYAKRFWRKVKFFGNYVDVQVCLPIQLAQELYTCFFFFSTFYHVISKYRQLFANFFTNFLVLMISRGEH